MNTYECLMPRCHAEVYSRHDVCDDCWEDRHSQLTALPDLYVMTYAMLTPGSRMLEINAIHVAAVDPGVPINLVALDTLIWSADRLAGWADWALARQGRPKMESRWGTGRRFLEATQILQCHDHRFATTDFAGDYVLDVWTVYRRLVVQCLPTEPRSLMVPCPDCDMPTVITRHADEYAMCLTCGTVWPHSQLPMLRRHVQKAVQQ